VGARSDERAAGGQHGDSPDGRCLPLSNLWLHSHLFPSKILQVPGLVVILYEKGVDYRQIFTDGRPLPLDPNPSFFGYSSGTWEKDTLVVRTNGFRDDQWADLNGNPLTDAATITERFRRPSYGNLDIEVTVDDPRPTPLHGPSRSTSTCSLTRICWNSSASRTKNSSRSGRSSGAAARTILTGRGCVPTERWLPAAFACSGLAGLVYETA
jgi:hypothetical protein